MCRGGPSASAAGRAPKTPTARSAAVPRIPRARRAPSNERLGAFHHAPDRDLAARGRDAGGGPRKPRRQGAPPFRESRDPAEHQAMNVSAPFITRPIATSLLGVATLCGGLLGYLGLPGAALAPVAFPSI